MIKIGITGSIAMGKTTAARHFQRAGIWVYDSDLAVHGLLSKGGEAVDIISKDFPEVIKNRSVDRGLLGELVFNNKMAIRKLEAILHPLVRKQQIKFLSKATRNRQKFAVLDVPLLFETGGDKNCDFTACVSAPTFLQYMRAMRRPKMTRSKLRGIIEFQIPNEIKCQKADFIIRSGLSIKSSLYDVKTIIAFLKMKTSKSWKVGWGR